MNLFYCLLLLCGILCLMQGLQAWSGWKIRRKLVLQEEDSERQQTQASFDYRTIIIANSDWLQFLKRLDESIERKLTICAAGGLPLVLMSLSGLLPLEMKSVAMIMLVSFIIITVLPAMLIKPGITTATKEMLNTLPYFIDLTAVCIQAGMTVESALIFIAVRSRDLDKNLTDLMQLMIKRAEVSGLEEALQVLYHSLNKTEMRMFCSSLQQSVHYGTSLYENLLELSKDMREMQLLDTEDKLGKLSAKMSVPLIIFIMFPLTILIVAPGILRILKNGLF